MESNSTARPETPSRRTRERLLEILNGSPSGATVAELASALGLKHNAVRKHLVSLARLGSVASERSGPTAVGRPAARYRATDGAPGYPDRMLARLLVAALGDLEPAEAEQIAFDSQPPGAGSSTLDDMLSSLGFAPADITSPEQARAGERAIELRACPYLELVARPNGTLICAFHRGLVRRDMPQGAALKEFRIAPDGPRCRVVLAG